MLGMGRGTFWRFHLASRIATLSNRTRCTISITEIEPISGPIALIKPMSVGEFRHFRSYLVRISSTIEPNNAGKCHAYHIMVSFRGNLP